MTFLTLSVRLPAELVRDLSTRLMDNATPSLDAFIENAVRNQLKIGKPSVAAALAYPHQKTVDLKLLTRPQAAAPLELTDPTPQSAQRLSVFTNRLSPLKVAVRTIANLASEGAWPTLEIFHESAAGAARTLGQQLKEHRRTDIRRPWVGYPTGDDFSKATSRFITSFTIQRGRSGCLGPLALLGLANLQGDSVALTRDGWRFAAAPSPLIDGAEGGILSEPEVVILLAKLRAAGAEFHASQEFLRIISEGRGNQDAVDEELAMQNRSWSSEMVVSHRSAMIGRLGDLALVTVKGRGARAQLTLTTAGRSFMSTQP